MTPDLHQIVLSYSRVNNPLKDWLVAVLKSWGVRVWDDQGRMNVADGEWRKQIEKAIGDGQMLVIVWTKELAQSDVWQREYMTALGNKKTSLHCCSLFRGLLGYKPVNCYPAGFYPVQRPRGSDHVSDMYYASVRWHPSDSARFIATCKRSRNDNVAAA